MREMTYSVLQVSSVRLENVVRNANVMYPAVMNVLPGISVKQIPVLAIVQA